MERLYEGDPGTGSFGARIVDLSRFFFNLWCLAGVLFLVLAVEAHYYGKSRRKSGVSLPA